MNANEDNSTVDQRPALRLTWDAVDFDGIHDIDWAGAQPDWHDDGPARETYRVQTVCSAADLFRATSSFTPHRAVAVAIDTDENSVTFDRL